MRVVYLSAAAIARSLAESAGDKKTPAEVGVLPMLDAPRREWKLSSASKRVDPREELRERKREKNNEQRNKIVTKLASVLEIMRG